MTPLFFTTVFISLLENIQYAERGLQPPVQGEGRGGGGGFNVVVVGSTARTCVAPTRHARHARTGQRGERVARTRQGAVE